jgi:hypothetical protein
MSTHKVELHFLDKNRLFVKEVQFFGTEQECSDFVKNFRQLANNEVGIVILPIQE